ncbi:MAG TPA: hypothetical protein VHO67_03335 [Polyangia bacterium]|nr:hypothetical protein [Polyangia bacterium]
MPCGTGLTCSAGKCVCKAGLTSCNGACVDLQSDPRNCGACGSTTCADKFMGCSGGQCVCSANTPNGLEICFLPGQVRGTCWGGSCVLPALGTGCNSASDCVPGGCSAPGGYCLGTIEVAGQVSCSDSNGPSVACPASQGCTDVGGRAPPFAVCGDGTASGTGSITCDGPSDCPANSECCAAVGGQHCLAQAQPGVVGSGCATFDTNPNGPQASVVCDPMRPTTTCPTGKSCVPDFGASLVLGFYCQ